MLQVGYVNGWRDVGFAFELRNEAAHDATCHVRRAQHALRTASARSPHRLRTRSPRSQSPREPPRDLRTPSARHDGSACGAAAASQVPELPEELELLDGVPARGADGRAVTALELAPLETRRFGARPTLPARPPHALRTLSARPPLALRTLSARPPHALRFRTASA